MGDPLTVFALLPVNLSRTIGTQRIRPGSWRSRHLYHHLYGSAAAVGGDTERFGGVFERAAVADERLGDLRSGRQHGGGQLLFALTGMAALPERCDEPDLLGQEQAKGDLEWSGDDAEDNDGAPRLEQFDATQD